MSEPLMLSESNKNILMTFLEELQNKAHVESENYLIMRAQYVKHTINRMFPNEPVEVCVNMNTKCVEFNFLTKRINVHGPIRKIYV